MESLRKSWKVQATESLWDRLDLGQWTDVAAPYCEEWSDQMEWLTRMITQGGAPGGKRALGKVWGGTQDLGSSPISAHSACNPGQQSSSVTFRWPESISPLLLYSAPSTLHLLFPRGLGGQDPAPSGWNFPLVDELVLYACKVCAMSASPGDNEQKTWAQMPQTDKNVQNAVFLLLSQL